MGVIDDHLRRLEVDWSVTAEKLAKAYRRKIHKWHPDHYNDDPEMLPIAEAQAKKINVAYEYLSELLVHGPIPHPMPRSSTVSGSKPKGAYRTQHTYNRKPFTPGFSDSGVFEVFIKSSHIVSAGYNRRTATMYIKFEGDQVYAYQDVPESVFVDFMAAESHGKFAHARIYGHYSHTRC